MNASERLQLASQLTLKRQFEEALAEFKWFHEHALTEEPALRGVRRSFALSYWVELGAHYPPALRELTEIRDRARNSLLHGTPDLSLFADVVAINHCLKDESASYELFRAIHEETPDFAAECFNTAFTSVVNAEDFTLARNYIPNPSGALSARLEAFNESIRHATQLSGKRRRAMRLLAFTSNFVSDVQRLLAVVQNTDGLSQAEQLLRASITGVAHEAIRKRVARRLDAKTHLQTESLMSSQHPA